MNQLAKTNKEVTTAQKNIVMKYLTFLLKEKAYAINILKIKEILEYGVITPIPKMPGFICGAINLRGKLVPVMDLLERLGHGKSEIEKRSCIVIVEMAFATEVLSIGVIVDAVSKVIDFKNSDIEPAPSFGGAVNTDFIEGMGKVDEEFVIILNIDKILSLDDLALLVDSGKLNATTNSETEV
ncbi:MAG: chemotaxis protein CheW [Gammaproteobacteria bacterium]|nr:chemotaxis protein CheW [Gammaproteobacteria bacterium]